MATGWAVATNKIPPATGILPYAILEAAAEFTLTIPIGHQDLYAHTEIQDAENDVLCGECNSRADAVALKDALNALLRCAARWPNRLASG